MLYILYMFIVDSHPVCCRRLVTNKLLLGVIILMELAILGAVIYLKFFRR